MADIVTHVRTKSKATIIFFCLGIIIGTFTAEAGKITLVTPTEGTVGTTITIMGEEYGPTEIVRVDFGSNLGVANVTTSEEGKFTAKFRITSHPVGQARFACIGLTTFSVNGGYISVISDIAEATSSKQGEFTASLGMDKFVVSPQITLISPTEGHIGTKIRIEGKGFAASEAVRVDLNRTMGIGRGQADEMGRLSIEFLVDAQPSDKPARIGIIGRESRKPLYVDTFKILSKTDKIESTPDTNNEQLKHSGEEGKSNTYNFDKNSFDEKINELVQQLSSAMIEKKKVTIAVVEFTDLNGNVNEFSRYLAEELITRLFQTGKFKVIERQYLNKVIEEQKLSLTGVINQDYAKKLGMILGVDAIVTGSMVDLQDSIKLNARIIETGNAEILSVASTIIRKEVKATEIPEVTNTEKITPVKIEPVLKKEQHRIKIGSGFGARAEFKFKVTKPGPIKAKVSWEGPELALILNGPGMENCYAREDGQSPLSLIYDVTQGILTKGSEWQISVINFSRKGGAIGEIVIEYLEP